VNAEELVERAVALLGREDRQGHGSPTLSLAIARGPRQRILRPVEIEAPRLSEDLNQAALFGETRIFDRTKGVDTAMEGSALSLRQEREGHVQLDEEGAVLIQLPVVQPTRRGTSSYGGFPALIQENVQQRIGSALTYATWLLERVDPIQRLTHVAIAARIDAAEHMAWRTQAEQDASPTSGSMGMGLSRERAPVQICQPRTALRLNRTHLVEDLLVPLRRIWKTGWISFARRLDSDRYSHTDSLTLRAKRARSDAFHNRSNSCFLVHDDLNCCHIRRIARRVHPEFCISKQS
jgi:hypothetical protein